MNIEIRKTENMQERKALNLSGKGCPVCGGPLIHAEGCLKCLYCGYGLCD